MNRNKTLAISFAMIFAAGTMVVPAQAHAAKLPGSCEVINSTACNPVSLLAQLIAMLGLQTQ